MSDRFRIHAYYIGSMLVGIIIALVAVKWGEMPKLVELLSFALTLTSLVLALLAIVYAFFSNASLSSLLSRLGSASDELRDSAEAVRSSTKALTEHVALIPAMVTQVTERVEQTHAMVKQLQSVPTRMLPETPMSNDAVITFLNASSIVGVWVLFACKLALDRKVSFTIVEFCTTTNMSTPDYFLSYLVASSAIGLVQYNSDQGGRITPIGIHNVLRMEIEGQVTKNLQRAMSEDHRSAMMRTSQAVRDFFTPPPVPSAPPA